MKAIFTQSLLICIALCFAHVAHAQNKGMPPGQAAKFGIDGDLKSDERQNGNFSAAGSHDWFKKQGGQGLGLIDTTGAAAVNKQIKAGVNLAFSRRMQFARYSVQDGILMMDASYARDYMGSDYTVFSGNSTKNAASPLSWGTSPNGGNVSDKTDIIDTYVSMRRNGNVITGNNPSNLMVTMALTTLATTGDHYVDFEFYKERINYNPVTGNFENSGPVATGGHSAWAFNADGSIKSWGDMTISFSFNNTSVSEIQILIWVAQTDYTKGKPKNFDFVANEYFASSSVNGYGYAAITPKGNGQVTAWGTVNSAPTAAPVWGSNSKEMGSNANNYFTDSYSAGQLAEAAVDLTSLGVDPAFYTGFNPCNPPFTRFITKSRSSSSFSSSLSDFTGPYEFLDAPTAPAEIIEPGVLTCTSSNVSLSPDSYLKGAYYNWSTTNGNITAINTNTSNITVNKPGKYYLSASIAQGCTENMDSVIVTEDRFKPKATASAAASMILLGQSLTLIGGDPVASNYPTPFGRSQGLTWQWSNTSGSTFFSTLQNPTITMPGDYRLILTETRNGCKDTAYTSVALASVLPVVFTGFTVTTAPQTKVNTLAWQVSDGGDVEKFVAEKSSNGTDFTVLGYVFTGNGYTAYTIKDWVPESACYYRIKAVGKAGNVNYTSIVKAQNSSAQSNSFTAYRNGAGSLVLNLTSAVRQSLTVSIMNMDGQVVKKGAATVNEGKNTVMLNDFSNVPPGVYMLMAQGPAALQTVKIKL